MSSIFKSYLARINISVLLLVLVSVAFGMFIPIYVDIMNGQLGKMAALPAMLVFAFLLIYDRILTVTLIIALRSAGDIFLESTKFAIGSYQVGVGGLINACIIIIALMLVFERPKEFEKKWLSGWGVFLAVALMGLAMSPVVGDAVRTWLALATYFAIFVCSFYFVKSKADFEYCLRLVVWSSILPSLYAIVDVALNSGSATGDEGFRLKSTFSHANIFAFYLIVVIASILYSIKLESNAKKVKQNAFLGLYMLFLMVLLLLTKTRSAWMGCLAIFMMYAAMFERKYFYYLIALPFVALLIPGMADRIADLGQGNEVINYSKLNSFAWRMQLWTSAIQWTKPGDYFIGHGLQSFKQYSVIFFPMAGGINWGAHSVFVQLFFELGFVGIAAFLWIYYKAIRELILLYKIDRLGAFLIISLICSFLICSFSDNMFDYLSFNWYLWFVIGAGCALVRCNPEQAVGRNRDIATLNRSLPVFRK